MNKNKAQEIRKRGCTLLNVNRGKDENGNYQLAVSNDFKTQHEIIILIHGFTSHGEYMGKELAPYLMNVGYQVFLFNYYSYSGILKAVQRLQELLINFNKEVEGKINSKKIFLVGHSMGGLVARKFTVDDANKFVRGVVMLATPNNGVMVNNQLMHNIIDASEIQLFKLFPQARTTSCQAIRELCKKDEDSTINKLNTEWISLYQNNDLPPTLSISGGSKYLEIGNNPLIENKKVL